MKRLGKKSLIVAVAGVLLLMAALLKDTGGHNPVKYQLAKIAIRCEIFEAWAYDVYIDELLLNGLPPTPPNATTIYLNHSDVNTWDLMFDREE